MRNMFKVLYAGYSLKNPETWKSRQLLLNVFVIIVAGLVAILPEQYALSQTDVGVVAEFVTLVGFSVYNAYFTVATTDKIGLPTPIEVVPTEVPLPESRPINPAGSIQKPGDGLV